MIEVDGSMMEGGGQLLRNAVTYATVMGKPVRIYNIRAKRKPPGLKPQHLTALEAVAEISEAGTSGLSIDSTEVEFEPGTIRGGEYSFNIGTAGSISLLLQCVAPVAAFADSPVNLRIVGGTAVRWSPPIPILDRVVWRAYRRMGFRGEVRVEREGFYPKGGGVVKAKVQPLKAWGSLNAVEIKKVYRVRGVSICGKLPEHVAERQARSAESILRREGYEAGILHRVADGENQPSSPGSFICLWAEAQPEAFMGADAMGERGKPAEKVGSEAAWSLIEQLRTGKAIDYHTADSLILPCSLARGESLFSTSRLTLHTLTAIELAERITGAEFSVEGEMGEPARIACRGVGHVNRSPQGWG